MNYLAHAYLAQQMSDAFRLGNLMADHIKGPAERVLEFLPPDMTDLIPEVIAGIQYHRMIDHRVDHFPETFQLRQQFLPEYRRYAGIVLDMAWDHLLARQWSAYSERPLTEFAQEQYRLLEQFTDAQPASMQHMVFYMVKNDWLVSYTKAEHIRKSLAGMSGRMRRENRLAEAYSEIPRLEQALLHSFPGLMDHLIAQPLPSTE